VPARATSGAAPTPRAHRPGNEQRAVIYQHRAPRVAAVRPARHDGTRGPMRRERAVAARDTHPAHRFSRWAHVDIRRHWHSRCIEGPSITHFNDPRSI
jgi:hypothetical protein